MLDKLDNEFCKRKGIDLFRVSYKDNMLEAIRKVKNSIHYNFLETENLERPL